VLKFDGDILRAKEIGGCPEDAGEFASLNSVAVVVGDPDLENAGLFGMALAATIEEGL